MNEFSQSESLALVIRRLVTTTARRALNRLPVSKSTKNCIVGFVFRRLPILVFWTGTYKNWAAEEARLLQQQELLKQRLSEPEEAIEYRERTDLARPDQLSARAIAFYLPQFHPIPENDEWWGEGFTEWTNVRRARAQFEGQRQPRRPGELGYYDLVKDPSIRRRQAAMARQYGLAGFCFYFYWFGGKRLLEQPVLDYADDEEVDFPFCLCWANEPWSRRWDGREQDVLMAQSHSGEDDISFIEYVSRYLENPKYLRVDGKPLLLVYRPGEFPDAKATTDRWRDWCRDKGIGEIYLAYTKSFDLVAPDEWGFDAAIEFPPNNMGLVHQPELVTPIADDFASKIYDWRKLPVRQDLSVYVHKIFRGATPQWDNTARKMENGAIVQGSSPRLFEAWIRELVEDAHQRFDSADERLIFVNAWNEWAEGAYLEPDQDYGYAWLEALRNGLLPRGHKIPVERRDLVADEASLIDKTSRKIIVVVHDLYRHGAQFLSLNFVATLSRVFGYEVTTVACGEGPLKARFEVYGRVIQIGREMAGHAELRDIFSSLRADGFEKAIVNSSASGWVIPDLTACDIDCVGLVHEMPEIVRAMDLTPGLQAMNKHARHVVFASEIVRDRTAREILGNEWNNSIIQPQGLYKRDGIVSLEEKVAARELLRTRFDLPPDARIIVGVGYGDHRKGVDIFCRWAIEAARLDPSLYFIWTGQIAEKMRSVCDQIRDEAGNMRWHVIFAGFQHDTSSFYKGADLYALTSREDPFPSTPIEAMYAGAPVIMVKGTSGIEDLSATGAVTVLDTAEPEGAAAEIVRFLSDQSHCRDAGMAGLEVAQSKFGFHSFVGDVLRLAGEAIPKVSVVVPNYNYAKHLPQRLSTILNQSMPVWEIIFLDDCSSDDSVAVAREFFRNCPIRYRIIENAENSGSVFAQWKKGVELAEGDVVWIAEADDWAAHNFVEVAVKAFEDEDVVVSYTQSQQAGEAGEVLCPHYLDYVADIDPERWRRLFVTAGEEELIRGLSVKNTLPNVSGVLFRRDAIARVLDERIDEILKYRVAGDWCVYAFLAMAGKFAFDPHPLNYHRRHTTSVTISRFTRAEWGEIRDMQARVQSMVDVPEPYKEIAAQYLDHLAERLLSVDGATIGG